ncbi:AF4/FMR2 family member 4 isoform X1 [Oopsacas minuta]|uniref:AF4/FMR2 family member lilli n=1 Tax=Oopsacas minuta TaxID=111878 RepID=A0AAV7K3R8_9METZ|nr:AF4/FMR2 family member 4 isoform X1 [Oopsacas minuta]
MSSSPLGTDLDHPFRRLESRYISFDRSVHFSEPRSTQHSDPLNLKISELLGPYSQVSPHLLSELKDSPDSLFGIEPLNTISPKHQRQRPSSSDQKLGKMMGQSSRPVSPPGKKHTPRQPFNPAVQRPNQINKHLKPQKNPENKPRPINPYPLHNSGKHGSRTFLSSSSPNTNSHTHKNGSISRKTKYDTPTTLQDSSTDIKMKKPINNTAPMFPKRPDKVRKEEHNMNSKKLLHSDTVNSSRPVNGEHLDFSQKISPKEDTKTATILPARVLKPPSDKPRPPTNKNPEEFTSKNNQVPNLDLSLSLNRSNLHDDSFNDIFAIGMEPLPTPLTEIQTPVGNKKFLAFLSNQTKPRLDLPQQKEANSNRLFTEKVVEQNSSDSEDSSDSDSEHEHNHDQGTTSSRRGDNFLDIIVSSDSESSDSSPIQAPSYTNTEDIFMSIPPKRVDMITEPAPVHNRGWESSPSSDSSNGDSNIHSWNKMNITSNHKTECPYWDSHRSTSPPRDLNPRLNATSEPVMHLKSSMPRSREMSHDSDSNSPKRLKISISLDKIAILDKVKPLIVSFPRVKISLPGDKPPESSKQMARVQPIQRLPDSGKDMSIPPTYSCPHRVAEVQPQKKIPHKGARNMINSPDMSWHMDACYEPPVSSTMIPPTQSSADDRWGTSSHTGVSYPSKIARPSTSHDYLTEAKGLKHQADHFKCSYKKALFYCEAALSFMLYGDQLEDKTEAIPTYSDTFDLLEFVLRPASSSGGGLGFSSSKQSPQLITICMRCQAVILNRIFVIKQDSLRSTHKELHEFFSVYKSDTKAKTPLSNKSPYASSWSPTNMVQVPQKIATMNSDYLQVLEYQFNSLELWNKSQLYEDDVLPFIQSLNNSVGKSVEIYSSIKDITTWCKTGLHWLRKDQT